ncbi:MAG: Uma2 family endonuclease [Actinomycetota bacterium]|nr:Uma2 family endonuclease [Actinomycetota bacterium]MDQ5809055.1 Uma2 family endonuclease [Actinomycetota bacterium]
MPAGVEERPIRPLTADEVLRMVDLGVLDDAESLELLGGVLRRMSPKSPAHETAKMRLQAWLGPGAVAGRYLVAVERPLIVPERTSMPEPDISVLEPRDYTAHHPTTALLVIEVAFSSLWIDTEFKPPLFAAAGVPEYWVVDIESRRLEVFAEPRRHDFAHRRTMEPRGTIAPRAVDVDPLDLGELFAGIG